MIKKTLLLLMLLSTISFAQFEYWLIECDISNANLGEAQPTLETVKNAYGDLVDNAELTGASSHTTHFVILCPSYTEAVTVFSNIYSTYGARFDINTYIFKYKR